MPASSREGEDFEREKFPDYKSVNIIVNGIQQLGTKEFPTEGKESFQTGKVKNSFGTPFDKKPK